MGKSELSQELQEAIRRKDSRGAVNALNRLVKLEPRNAVHRLRMGEYYVKLKDNQKAIASYQKAAEIFGEDGFIVKALAAYKIILRIDPRNQKARSGMEGLHGESREQAPGLSVSRPGISPVSSGAGSGKPQGPVMDAWEISKSHLLKDLEPSTGQSPPAAIPVPEKTASSPASPPVPEKTVSPPSPPPEEDEEEELQEELDEALIGSTPLDPDSYKEPERAEAHEKTGEASPVKSIIPSGGAGSNVLTLFSSLTKEEFTEVTDRMNPYLFEPGAKIVSEGEKGDSVFVVSSGSVQVSTRVGHKEVVLAELKDDDFFGEVSFLTGRPRTANIVARTATEILELRGDDLRAVIEKFPRVRPVLEEFHRVRALDTVEKIMTPPMTPPMKGPGDAD